MKQSWYTLMNNIQLPATPTWILGMLGIMGLVVLVYWLVRKHALVIHRDEVAIMFNLKNGSFAGFRPSGRYLLLPGGDHLKGTISTCKNQLQGTCEVHTRDGYPLNLSWVLEYQLDPESIDPVLQPSMADILLANPTKMADLQTNHCLEKITGQYTLEALRRDGVHQKINDLSTRSMIDCLAAYGILVDEIGIGSVQWPQENGFLYQDKTPSRLRESDLSHFTNPRSNLLNQAKTTTELAKAIEEAPHRDGGEDNAQEITYHAQLTPNIHQHTDHPGDKSPVKLVV